MLERARTTVHAQRAKEVTVKAPWHRRERSTYRWPAPPELALTVPVSSRAESVLAHEVEVNPTWWRDGLTDVSLTEEAPEAVNDRINRAQLFALGHAALDNPIAARRLLWATLSWGTGKRQRLNRRRIASVTQNLDWSGRLLVEAARTSRESAEAGLTALQRGNRPLLSHLGPSFSTKFLYFAGGGDPNHPCLILDKVVADRLRALVSPSFPYRRHWGPPTYSDYCLAIGREARRLSTPERAIAPDELEVQLFTGGGTQQTSS